MDCKCIKMHCMHPSPLEPLLITAKLKFITPFFIIFLTSVFLCKLRDPSPQTNNCNKNFPTVFVELQIQRKNIFNLIFLSDWIKLNTVPPKCPPLVLFHVVNCCFSLLSLFGIVSCPMSLQLFDIVVVVVVGCCCCQRCCLPLSLLFAVVVFVVVSQCHCCCCLPLLSPLFQGGRAPRRRALTWMGQAGPLAAGSAAWAVPAAEGAAPVRQAGRMSLLVAVVAVVVVCHCRCCLLSWSLSLFAIVVVVVSLCHCCCCCCLPLLLPLFQGGERHRGGI